LIESTKDAEIQQLKEDLQKLKAKSDSDRQTMIADGKKFVASKDGQINTLKSENQGLKQ
jgi:hypothetical protein